ncbi:kinase-like domain-containing protein [Melampsora americana]|nr:kinase-like domain-containing protein [Melampsora americana]
MIDEENEPFQNLINQSTLIKQGAEARVYKIKLINTEKNELILKHRFSKTYRHSNLDSNLNQQRLSYEARSLIRALKFGIHVPLLRSVNLFNHSLLMEFIDGPTVKEFLLNSNQFDFDINDILSKIGHELFKLHQADLIHGDLTTSNMMIKLQNQIPKIFLIDFGLSFVSNLLEDKSVDLYVLERSFLSTHSKLNFSIQSDSMDSEKPKSSEGFSNGFQTILNHYQSHLSIQDSKSFINRFEVVRARGRKRCMIG